MVNGAGLAMATMDIIQLLGGAAANFLDVGGGASVEKVSKAFEIMSMHPKIKVGFINIFGGIMRCDFVAQGLVNALEKTNGSIPLVVRMKGFKELEAQKILKEAKAEIEIINSFQLAAKRAVNIATNL
jgi:succinyl-CoA synthetase beta subunit